MRALIVGGGIGGATAAIALSQAGWDVRVFERAPGPAEVGAGISLWGNAVRALSALGLQRPVVGAGDVMQKGLLMRSDGRVLSTMDIGSADRELGMPSIVIHRAELLSILLAHAPAGAVEFGARCTGIEQDAGAVRLTLADGRTETGECLIGADGVRSLVRHAVLGAEEPRYSGYTSWRGVLPFPESRWPSGNAAEVWGRGQRMGITRVSGGRVYWWITRNAPPGGRDKDAKAELLDAFGDWFELARDMIRWTPDGAIIRTDIVDRAPSHRWGAGRVTLLGDAAHAPTPNMGQGACMAIESGLVLGRHLAKCLPGAVPECLRHYERARFRRTATITRNSWRLGKVGQLKHPALCAARNFGAASTPQVILRHNHRKYIGFVA